jgi:hypothetical protein
MTAARLVVKAPTAAELARKPRRLSDDDVADMIFLSSSPSDLEMLKAIGRSGAMPCQNRL